MIVKRFLKLILPLFLILCFCTGACSDGGISPAPAPNTTPASSELAIPEYAEDSLYSYTTEEQSFFSAPWILGTDKCWFDRSGALTHQTDTLLQYHPTPAIRNTDRGTKYVMYDLDSGYRLFYFSRSRYDGAPETLCGFPVVVGELLSYSAFSDLKIGDPIEKVERIDRVATLHKKVIEESGMVPEAAAEMAAMGRPCTSFYYLSDGVLKIEYEMLADRSLLISDIAYSADHKMESEIEQITDPVIDYHIDPQDLPQL